MLAIFASCHRQQGLTLLELAVVLALGVLLWGVAVPNLSGWIQSARLRNQAEALARGMTMARFEAIKRGHRVNLCKSVDRITCAEDGGWETGWILFVDLNRNAVRDDDEPILREEGPAPAPIRIAGNAPVSDYVSYTVEGHARMANGALQMGTFTVCRAGLKSFRLVLAHSGRVRTERGAVC